MTTATYQYGFIGCGNMAKAIIQGAIDGGTAPSRIIASTRTAASGKVITEELGIRCVQDNNLCLDADVVVLAVKPQILTEVLAALDTNILKEKLIVSVIAGIPCRVYFEHIAPTIRLVRTMPNMPSMIGQGMTGLYAENCSEADKALADTLMKSTGKNLWVDSEAGINYVNAISGSGPAYFYGFIHHLAESGEKLGLTYEEALTLALQTAIGSSQLAAQHHDGTPASMQALVNQITSKGGTTFEAMQSFQSDELDKVIDRAVQRCYQRALELGEQYPL